MDNSISIIHWARLRVPMILLAVMGSATAAMIVADFRFNITPSEPIGFYKVLPVSVGIERGDLIEFCYVGKPNEFMYAGDCGNSSGYAPFLKTVAGVPGDLVVLSDDGVMVNGLKLPDSRPLLHSVSDPFLALPVLRGQFLLKKGQYWVYGSGEPARSYDSRYFGPVNLDDIQSVSKK